MLPVLIASLTEVGGWTSEAEILYAAEDPVPLEAAAGIPMRYFRDAHLSPETYRVQKPYSKSPKKL